MWTVRSLSFSPAMPSKLDNGINASVDFKELDERRRARRQQAIRIRSLKKLHLRISLDLLREVPAVVAALGDARNMVELWAREELCSPFYIDSWRRMLSGSASEVGAAMAHMDKDWESALLQKSPFGGLLPNQSR